MYSKMNPSQKAVSGSHIKNAKRKHAPVSYISLFRYASNLDKALVFLSIGIAIVHGALLPILTVLLGRIIDGAGSALCVSGEDGCVSSYDFGSDTRDILNWFLYIGIISFVLSFFQLMLSLFSANRIGSDFRQRFFSNLLRQDCDFFDDHMSGSLTNLVINDIQLIQAGIGDRLTTVSQYMSTLLTGFIVGLVHGWKLTLLILGVTPFLLFSGRFFGDTSSSATSESLGASGEAGSIAAESISLIRTVTTFGRQEQEARRYEKSLEMISKAATRAALRSGLGLGVAMFFALCTYAVAFWYGSVLARNGEMMAGDVLLTIFAITVGASLLGMAGPAFKAFGAARAAAPRVFEIIERKSEIDPLDEAGKIPHSPPAGRLTFENVDFTYPSMIVTGDEPNLVLRGFDLDVPAGSSEALVGQSGSGKSTVTRLIQRLYDPIAGSVKLDGIDLRDLNVRWLRSQIGVVSQDPSLFNLSIRENIALGAGVEFSEDESSGEIKLHRRAVSDSDIIEAAKMANAHDFISQLPEKYDTVLGERGAMLSGGQKQRVCIARALVRKPKILILDEFTASLDVKSESLVQEALEKASAGRTTVTIAHRLSTVRRADHISFLQKGKIVERGPHRVLIARDGGLYASLFSAQELNHNDKVEPEEPLPVLPVLPSDTYDLELFESRVEDIESLSPTEHVLMRKRLLMRTLRISRSDWPYLALGGFGAILAGSIWALSAIPIIKLVESILLNKGKDDTGRWVGTFVALGGVAFVGNVLQHGMLGIYGEKLTRKLRSAAFRQLLRQEMGYFNMEESSIAALIQLLSTDAAAVKGLTGDILGFVLHGLGALLGGMVIAALNCWRLALVVLAIIPGIALGGYLEMYGSAGIDSGQKAALSHANSIAAEAVDNVSTVRTIGVEDYFLTQYKEKTDLATRVSLRRAFLASLAFGFAEFCEFFIWYAATKAGGDFIARGQCSFPAYLVSSMALLYCGTTLGNVFIFAPNLSESRVGAAKVYGLLDRVSRIDPLSREGHQVKHVDGNVGLEKVYFEYPRRPYVSVLQGITLNIESGKTLAIVGTSGHGKSTIISLLLRLYDVRKGQISVDNQNIAELNTKDIRSHFSLVSQEPELFCRSVFENIAYGANPEKCTSMEEVVQAAKLANAHQFITALPQGYNTLVGPRGEALSGGQRQRIAIARALVRRPAVLLLDEATSAIDSESEILVQKALESASEGRTTIVVAHRLSTIRNADAIAFVRSGKVVEIGNHDTLLRQNGFYADLVRQQVKGM